MPDIDLNTLSLKELKDLRKDIDRAIASFGDRQKAEARAMLEARAKELGFTLAELSGGPVRKTRRGSGEARYRHPEDASVTWSGLGRRPQWYVDAIAAGKSPEDLAV